MNELNKNLDRIGKSSAPLIPKQGAGDKPLFFVLTLMAFLAGLIFLITSMTLRATQDWRTSLDDSVTVQLYLPIAMSDTAGRVNAVRSTVKLVQAFPGVTGVDPLPDSEAKKRLEPWLGTLELPDDLPLPVILSVSVTKAPPLDVDALKNTLKTAGVQAEVNTHKDWQDSIDTNASAISKAMIFLFLCIFLGGVSTSVFATHSQIGTHRKIISVLTQVGAKNFYIARLFTQSFLIKGLIAGILGCILALMFVLLFQVMSVLSDENLLQSFSLTLWDIIYLVGVAVLFGLVCGASACATGLTLLRSEQRQR